MGTANLINGLLSANYKAHTEGGIL